jgi:hypothetical protein
VRVPGAFDILRDDLRARLDRQPLDRGLTEMWPSLRAWLLLQVPKLEPRRDWLALLCTSNGPDAEGIAATAEELAQLPDGSAYRVTLMRVVNEPAERGGQRSAGVEAWYAGDADWDDAAQEPDWVSVLPIGFELWWHDGQPADAFIRAVERTSFFRLAMRKPALSVTAFGLDDD